MKIAAIISEYNPFHNGHAYQIQKTKKELNIDYVIAIMSGNYVQRGEPAIFDKWTRTQLALRGGIDVVIELPTIYSTASAELFAKGAVDLLVQLNCVDYLSFGSEYGHLEELSDLAKLFLDEPEAYRQTLKSFLKEGYSFPKARSLAANLIYPEHKKLLKGSNNILAIEYLKALMQSSSTISPFTVKRIGSDYLETKLANSYASATAIRMAIKENMLSFEQTMPSSCANYLLSELNFSAFPIFPGDCYPCYRYLLNTTPSLLEDIFDFPIELKNRLCNILDYEKNYDHFIDQVQSKNYTKTTIQRALLHSFLNIKQAEITSKTQGDLHSYIKVLGFKRSASPVLALIKNHSKHPLITNVADHQKLLDTNGKTMLKHEISYTRLYNELVFQKTHQVKKNDYTHPIIIL